MLKASHLAHVAVCSSSDEVQEAARSVSKYSKQWGFKLNSATSAIVHVAAEGSSTMRESGTVYTCAQVEW